MSSQETLTVEKVRWLKEVLSDRGKTRVLNYNTNYPALEALCDHWLATHPSRDGGELPFALLSAARDFISSTPHGDNCYVSAHYDGDPGDRCNCGHDSIVEHIDAALNSLPSQHQPAQSGGGE